VDEAAFLWTGTILGPKTSSLVHRQPGPDFAEWPQTTTCAKGAERGFVGMGSTNSRTSTSSLNMCKKQREGRQRSDWLESRNGSEWML